MIYDKVFSSKARAISFIVKIVAKLRRFRIYGHSLQKKNRYEKSFLFI